MARSRGALVLANLKGRNGYDPPSQIPDDQAVEMLNVDLWDGTFANKRQGSTALSMTFSSGGPFTAAISSLVRHVPGADETAAELWAFDSETTPVVGRLAGATTWTAPTLVDALANGTAGLNVVGASLNGMLYLCYDSSQNRLHVWDPSDSKVRRVGLATPNPPTTATLGGAGLTITRSYRIRTVDISGSDTKRRSEASTVVTQSITDDSGIRVTRPTLPTSEDETHWEVEAADAATGPWYRIAQVATGTSTYDDTASSISTTTPSPEDGINYPPPSPKYILSDDNRLLMASSFETSGGYVTPKDTRLWFTAVLGSTDVGDSERIPSGNYLDFEAPITGLAGPINGAVYVFSYRRIWRLVPTGNVDRPYLKYTVVNGVGCIHHKSAILADDEQGNPSLYFWSHRGPYRLGQNGLQYLGRDVEDLPVNVSTTGIPVHGIYHADKHQVWWWVATGTSTNADAKLVFDVQMGETQQGGIVRKGWFKHTGDSSHGRCSVMFSNTVGATMSRDWKPYIGQLDNVNVLWKCDSTATNDAGGNFQAYVDTKEYVLSGLGVNDTLMEPSLLAKVASGVTITVTGNVDHGLRSDPTGSVSLTASGSETRVQKKVEGFAGAEVGSVSLRIGDSAVASNQWTLDALVLPYLTGADR